MTLRKEELTSIVGGGSYSVAGIIAGIAVFVVGFIDGLFRPLKCR